MFHIVLPVAACLASIDVIDLVVVVYVLVTVIDVDIAVAPSASPAPASAPGGAERETSAPRQTHSGIIARIFIRIVRIRGLAINYDWIIGWNVDHLRVGLLNYDYLLATLNSLRFHFLLRTGF